MTSSLGLRAVAEVVETEAAARSLAELGCNFGQGNYFCAPLEAAEALELLRRSPSPSTVIATVQTGAPAPPPRTERAADATMILEDTPTLVLPDTPTLALKAVIDPEIEVAEEAGVEGSRHGR
jgi:hypothetical protein